MSGLHEADAARDWLAVGLSRARMEGEHDLQEAAPLLETAASELAALPPPGVLLDLARLFRASRPRVRRSTADGPDLRAYEDTVLGRLLVDPLRIPLLDALAGLPERLQDAGLVVLVERILERVDFQEGVAVHPGAIRELARTTRTDLALRALDAGEQPLLDQALDALVRCFRRVPRPLRASDVLVLGQLELLERRSDRLALSQVIASAELLARGLPKRIRNTRRRAGHVSTRLLDDSAYPVGGFSSISTRGSIENLVTSELALMEDGDEVDLFDVRLMEGELLYYTRDETAFVRARRHLVLTLSAGLLQVRYRDEGLPFQRPVLALGWVVALARVLVRWLAGEDLLLQILLPPEESDTEANLLRLALADGLQAGWARVEQLEPDGLPVLLESAARLAPVDHIALDTVPAVLPELPHTWTTAVICQAQPELRTPFAGQVSLTGPPLDAWQASLRQALLDLV